MTACIEIPKADLEARRPNRLEMDPGWIEAPST
jgi:hypothetical protein